MQSYGTWLLALLAALAMGASALADAPQAGKQTAHERTVRTDDGERSVRYLLFVPAGYETRSQWPLLLFLHGAGERGDDLQQVKQWGPPSIVEQDAEFPFIVVSPQCPAGQRWQADVLAQLVEQIMADERVDPARVYVTGLSMGGFGTWSLLAHAPQLFAAGAPICGGGDPASAAQIIAPVWAFHGDDDEVIPLVRSQQMVDAVQRAGGDAKLTVYEGVGHNSWSPAYADPQLYQWLLAHERPELLTLQLRRRVETSSGSGRFHALREAALWKPQETAIIVCDMWDLHHGLNAVRRVQQLAPRMNEVLVEARNRGVTIIHAPSECMDAYRDHPARRRALDVPLAENLPPEINSWCDRIPSEEQGEYPIDQSDGGEDDDPEEHRQWAVTLESLGRNPRAPWQRQTDLIEIDSQKDYITDRGDEVWSILERYGIENVILVGVHTNMCVLGRPFGLRQMARNDKNVVLMRDMTDTMYNPEMPPFVSHFTGTDLIVEHIEKWICPTITSDQLLGGRPFRFPGDRRPHLVVVMAEDEYETERTLAEFASERLGHDFRVSLVFGSDDERNDVPGLEALEEADVMLISVRRRALPPDQMAAVRRFVESGRGVVGVRTANHAFSLRGDPPPEGRQTWESFDLDVFGGNYVGHHGPTPPVEVTAAASDHPILRGVDLRELTSYGSLYRVSPLTDATQPLLIGSIPERPAEPVAWTHTTQYAGRAFYSSLYHQDDFQHEALQRLLHNALLWAAGE